MEGKQRKEETIWGKESRKYYERNGYSPSQIRLTLEENENLEEIVSDKFSKDWKDEIRNDLFIFN